MAHRVMMNRYRVFGLHHGKKDASTTVAVTSWAIRIEGGAG